MSVLDDAMRATVREELRDVLRQELRAALTELRPASVSASGDAPSDSYLSLAEAAALARVSKNTLRAWIKDGKLPRRMAGRELRVRRDELHRLLAAEPEPSKLTADAAVARILARRG